MYRNAIQGIGNTFPRGLWSCRQPLTGQCQEPCKHLFGFVQVLGLVLSWDEIAWAGKGEPSSYSCNDFKGEDDELRLKNKTKPTELHKVQPGRLLRKGCISSQVSVSCSFDFRGHHSHLTHTQSCSQRAHVCCEDF